MATTTDTTTLNAYEIQRRQMSRSEIERRLEHLRQISPEADEAVLLEGGLFTIQEIEAAIREAAESGAIADADETIASIRVGPVSEFDAREGSPLI